MYAKRMIVAALVVTATWQIAGCTPPTIPIEFGTEGTPLAQFDLQAGVPAQATANFDFTPSVVVGSGTFELDASAISVTATDTTGGKKTGALQQGIPCNIQVEADNVLTTCLDEGGTEADCAEEVRLAVLACLGDTMTLEVTCWINDDVATVFENGDRYGAFRVTVDANGQGTSVSPTTITLSQRTVNLLNSGTFGIGCELIFGDDATAAMDSFTLNLGL